MDIKSLVTQSRIEVLPFKSVIPKLELVPEGSTVQIATHDIDKMTFFLKECAGKFDLKFVPHLPARLLEGQDHLKKTLATILTCRVDDVFIIGGDESKPRGPYHDSLTLLHGLADMGYLSTFRHVGTGSYPTGHPFIPEETLVCYLKGKQEFVTYIVGNLDFDYKSVLRYVGNLRENGIDKPFIASIIGAVEKKNLFGLLKEFSPKKTMNYMRSHPTLFLNLMFGRYLPDKFLKGMAENEEKEYNLSGVLFSTFNSIESHVAWMDRIQRQ
ncbi:MAG: hypothetical protein WCK90_05790 [archaeon]